jgi:hypothetical protein
VIDLDDLLFTVLIGCIQGEANGRKIANLGEYRSHLSEVLQRVQVRPASPAGAT